MKVMNRNKKQGTSPSKKPGVTLHELTVWENTKLGDRVRDE